MKEKERELDEHLMAFQKEKLVNSHFLSSDYSRCNRDQASDSNEVVIPLMLDGTYLSRNFATLGPTF